MEASDELYDDDCVSSGGCGDRGQEGVRRGLPSINY